MSEKILCEPCRTGSGPCLGSPFCESQKAKTKLFEMDHELLTGRTIDGTPVIHPSDTSETVRQRLERFDLRRKRFGRRHRRR